jgi:hypothetical protein
MEQAHLLVTPSEVDQALLAYMLKRQGVDPEEYSAKGFSVVYRIVDGKVFAAIHVDAVVRNERGE